ncbi:capsule assembly Wzi family protein [Pseudoalteromonas denitrificans]|uniref:Capsule assembly protein Wzi n=1 Tax=Pseudoalteromonas denitrificans DSM 6059 TaxID=1123010 RepID=A0A1I1DU36_9GAMM|nr:capsule assembly Wzi family protein [Pseudoalteromonas denitrificans]SFB78401.1 Capsule assembly protein Wzi [Pseudoalteromonas denitrificans DSM 6059]
MKLTKTTIMICALLGCTHSVKAEPWIGTNDVYLRNAIELLVSQGLINRPVNTYPLMWQGIAQDIKRLSISDIPNNALFAYTHIQYALKFAQKKSLSGIKLKSNNQPSALQSFGERYQEKAAIQGYSILMGERVTAKLSLQYNKDANNQKKLSYDDSYLAVLLGNWSFSAEQINHWWGPSNDNALLLSNNATPMPSLRISRLNTDYYGPSWLSFIGPWNITALISQQKHLKNIATNTSASENRFFGMRFSSVPLPGLELAVSQTAQFNGSDINDLTNVFLGKNKINSQTGINEYNQLTSIDFKYSHIAFGQSFAVYGELAGNKKSSLIPEEKNFTTGLEAYFGLDNQVIKTYLEYSDTVSQCTKINLDNTKTSQHCSYEHINFSDGYKHYNQNIGPAIDSQAKSYTLGINYHQTNGLAAFAKIRHIKQDILPIDSIAEHTKHLQLDIGYQQGLFNGLLKVSGSVFKVKQHISKSNKTETSLQASWEYRF